PSELKVSTSELKASISELWRVLASSGDAASLGEISLAKRVLNVFLVKLKNKGVVR
ncbi:hypothetical protein A2U01_0078287, partial [Trifolium medium]|nr:hypothetical protein [Trifolium medium]